MASLVIMAAGLGNRYGGLKQIEPVGPMGEILLEYNVYDALLAGFDKVIVILTADKIDTFAERFGNRIARFAKVVYASQSLDKLPPAYTLYPGREKPWGTGHALYCAAEHIHEPCCVINADDYYGRGAFAAVAAFFNAAGEKKPYPCCMVGYQIEKTMYESGSVSRGVCRTDGEGMLMSIKETPRLARCRDTVTDLDTGAVFADGTIVSMNMWGFPRPVLSGIEADFAAFLALSGKSPKDEFYLPSFVEGLIKRGDAAVKVLCTDEIWYGVTYREDRLILMAALEEMTRKGLYPRGLFGRACSVVIAG